MYNSRMWDPQYVQYKYMLENGEWKHFTTSDLNATTNRYTCSHRRRTEHLQSARPLLIKDC
jgi:hypothetical protein